MAPVYVSVTEAAKGGPGRMAKWRIAWSAEGDAHRLDFRSARARYLEFWGLAGVRYVYGASARDWTASAARRRVGQILAVRKGLEKRRKKIPRGRVAHRPGRKVQKAAEKIRLRGGIGPLERFQRIQILEDDPGVEEGVVTPFSAERFARLELEGDPYVYREPQRLVPGLAREEAAKRGMHINPSAAELKELLDEADASLGVVEKLLAEPSTEPMTEILRRIMDYFYRASGYLWTATMGKWPKDPRLKISRFHELKAREDAAAKAFKATFKFLPDGGVLWRKPGTLEWGALGASKVFSTQGAAQVWMDEKEQEARREAAEVVAERERLAAQEAEEAREETRLDAFIEGPVPGYWVVGGGLFLSLEGADAAAEGRGRGGTKAEVKPADVFIVRHPISPDPVLAGGRLEARDLAKRIEKGGERALERLEWEKYREAGTRAWEEQMKEWKARKMARTDAPTTRAVRTKKGVLHVPLTPKIRKGYPWENPMKTPLPFWYPGIQYDERPIAGQVANYYQHLYDYGAMGPMVGVPNPIDDPFVYSIDTSQNPRRKPARELRYSRNAREFISQQISKYVRPPYNMPQHQAVAVAISSARKKGYKVPAQNPAMMASPYPFWPTPEMGGYRAPLPVRPQIPNYHGLLPGEVPPPSEPNPPKVRKAWKKGSKVQLLRHHDGRDPGDFGTITGPGHDRRGKRAGHWSVRWEKTGTLSRTVPVTKLQLANPDTNYLMVVNPSSNAARSFKQLMGRKPKAAELKAYAKAYEQYVTFHGEEPRAMVPVQVPAGSSPFVVGVGQAKEMNYEVPGTWSSARGGTRWTHKAGDHGRKHKTKPAYFAGDPKTKSVLLAQPKGSKVYFDPEKGLMG